MNNDYEEVNIDLQSTGIFYQEGRTAYLNGYPLSDCAYRMGSEMQGQWVKGWYSIQNKVSNFLSGVSNEQSKN